MQRKILGFSMTALAVAALSACGGGGGSSGETSFPYTISLSSNKEELPVNLAFRPPTFGTYASYTATLTVQVRTGNRAAPFGTPVQCNITQGLPDSGVLYYLDGENDGEDDDGNLLPSREVALETGAEGYATFHVHSQDKSGTVLINCSATDPRDQKVLSAFQRIEVGVPRRNAPARIAYQDETGRFPLDVLGTNPNTDNSLRTAVEINAYVTDDLNQIVTSRPGEPNLEVRITNTAPGEPGADARLLYDNRQMGHRILVNTNSAGQGQFTLRSGPVAGPIMLEMRADRCNNNVADGIEPQCEITAPAVVRAVSARQTDELEIAESSLAFDVTRNTRVMLLLNAEGGTPPYTWTEDPAGRLARYGMNLSADGILTGRITGNISQLTFPVRVTDHAEASVRELVTLTLEDPQTGGGTGGGTTTFTFNIPTSSMPHTFAGNSTGTFDLSQYVSSGSGPRTWNMVCSLTSGGTAININSYLNANTGIFAHPTNLLSSGDEYSCDVIVTMGSDSRTATWIIKVN